jgi:hypothetical protein
MNMGTDCKIYLPGNVRISDVANVLGITLGAEARWCGSDGATWVIVPEVAVHPSMPEMASIITRGRRVSYHFEVSRPNVGRRLASLGAGPEAVAVARVLVDFFGGYADFNDCDATDRDYEQPDRSDAENCPEDGVEWDALMDRIWALYESRKKASE